MVDQRIAIDWASIDIVCFDMDGTLLDLGYDNEFWLQTVPKLYAEKHGLSEAAAYERVLALYEAQKGKLTWYCLDHWTEALELPLLEHKKRMANKIRFRPGAEALISWLRANKKQCYLVTNAHPDVLAIKLAHTQMESWFDVMVSAHQLGLAKEQPGFWQRFQQHYHLIPERTLFIDDSENVLAAAEQAGIGQLLAVAQPDLSQPARQQSRYPLVHDFFAMMPESNETG